LILAVLPKDDNKYRLTKKAKRLTWLFNKILNLKSEI